MTRRIDYRPTYRPTSFGSGPNGHQSRNPVEIRPFQRAIVRAPVETWPPLFDSPSLDPSTKRERSGSGPVKLGRISRPSSVKLRIFRS
ncbi:hypothetical protein Trydic_g12688 [Trypoxylus dichotomus]